MSEMQLTQEQQAILAGSLSAPSELALAYLQRLQSPLKAAFWFESSAHFPFLEEPERFLEELRKVEQAVSAHRAGLTE